MGRKMFSGGSGPWDDDPNADGWWGDDPPFHHRVFVLTHHPRESVTKQGGTTFTFVTDGIESALEQARAAAAGKDVQVTGGARSRSSTCGWAAGATTCDQHGSPRDPQPGNAGGRRDVLRTAGNKPIGPRAPQETLSDEVPAGAAGDPAPAAPSGEELSLDPTLSAPSLVKAAGQRSLTLVLSGPAGSSVAYSVGDGTRSVAGSATVGQDGTVAVVLDVSGLADGTLTASATFVDAYGNAAAASAAIAKDTAPPVIAAALPGTGVYDIGSTISFGLGADASAVGISATLDGRALASGSIDPAALMAGTHTIVVTAVDAAGNVGTRTLVFQVRPTLSGLMAAVNNAAAKGLVTAKEQSSLISQLQSAAKGSAYAKLSNVIKEVERERGRSIDGGFASLLLNWANDLLGRL